jgi:hypothetical protein
MSVITCIEGSVFSHIEVILDEFDQPVIPIEGSPGPKVRLFDTDKSIIVEQYATVDAAEPGAWRVDLPIPKMGLTDSKNLRCVWLMRSDDMETYKITHTIQVTPETEERLGEVIAVEGRDYHLTVVLPIRLRQGKAIVPANVNKGLPAQPAVEGDLLSFSLYRNNQPLMEHLPHTDSSVKLSVYSNKVVAKIPNVAGTAKLEPLLLYVEHTPVDAFTSTSYSFKTWIITPQILLAANSLEQFINKARIQNVVPELEYTQSDLVEYLSRGLNLFNSFPPQLTAFTGTNMQGMLLDGWLQCSAYYALAAQLQAEGAMAFDFSGQDVSLNVDRTPSIEAALGRVESALNENVKPMKKLLAKAGVNSGDGSQGGRFIDGSSQLGVLSLTNAPTTRIPWTGRGASWSRGFL